MAAKSGDKNAYALPRPKVEGSEFDFSFSGLKTAVLNTINSFKQKSIQINKNDLCASFEHAICDMISDRVILAARKWNQTQIVVCGGVCANSAIRARLKKECEKNDFELYLPETTLCGDNAAMVASQAYYEFLEGNIADMSLNAFASLAIDY